MKHSAAYVPLEQDEKGDEEKLEAGQKDGQICSRQRQSWVTIVRPSILWVIITILGLLNAIQWRLSSYGRVFEREVFSPAQTAVKHQDLVLTGALPNDPSPYQGPPSEENNELWEDLYNFGLSSIPMTDAARLMNRTVPIPGKPGEYVVTLNLFHDLHCLNMIRKRVWISERESPPLWGLTGIVHMDHCIDQIRQALMCSSDISPRPFGWDPKLRMVMPINNVIRTCRNFDSIRDWARTHQTHDMNMTFQVEDPLGNVVIEEKYQEASDGSLKMPAWVYDHRNWSSVANTTACLDN